MGNFVQNVELNKCEKLPKCAEYLQGTKALHMTQTRWAHVGSDCLRCEVKMLQIGGKPERTQKTSDQRKYSESSANLTFSAILGHADSTHGLHETVLGTTFHK